MEIREKEKAFLLDVPISGSGLFGDVVNTVVDKFRAAKTQSAPFKQFIPWRVHEPASASSSRERLGPSKEPVGRVSEPMYPPPYMVWGAHGRPASRQRPRKRVDLKCPNKPPAAASSGRSWCTYQEKRHFKFSPHRVVTGFVDARRDTQGLPSATVFPALTL